MISLIIIISLILVLNPLFDFWIINGQNVYIDHARSTFIWLMVYTLCIGGWYAGHIEYSPFLLRCVVLLPLVRWIAHDLILNGLRGLKWDYLGKGKKAALSDKLLARLPFHFMWLKVGLLVGVILLVLLK